MEFIGDIYGSDPYKPSLFELVAQEQLRDHLQPALKYVLNIFAQQYPRYLLRVVNRHEEFYALMMFFVERHYLRNHGASFSENFYGLKRRRTPVIETPRANAAVGGVPEHERLLDKDIRRSLFFLVGIPYIRAKAHDYYESLGGGVDIDEGGYGNRVTEPATWKNRCRHAFKSLYPWVNTFFELGLFVSNVAYLFDKSPFHRPWLSWIGVDLRRLGPHDYVKTSSAATPKTGLQRRNLLQMIGRLLISSPRLLLDSLKFVLPMSIFFIRFLEWWYSPSSPARLLSTPPKGPAIPPPRMLPPHPKGVPIDPKKYGQCPLCRDNFANPTALPTGYVFCYRCIHNYVEEHGKCPVTLLPARVWQLRKVLL